MDTKRINAHRSYSWGDSFADVTACGIPVTVKFRAHPAEPDVGIRAAYVEEFEIVAVNGRKITGRHAKWLYDKISEMAGENDRILRACEESEEG